MEGMERTEVERAPGDIVRLGRLSADPSCEVFFAARPEREIVVLSGALAFEGAGCFAGRGYGSTLVTKRLVSTLRADLERAFGIEEGAIDDYVKKIGWRARFRVED
jgi:hypothetical protein